MSWKTIGLADAATLRTGKLDSNAAVPNGEYPFFTCAQETFRIDTFAFDTEAVLLGGNNAAGIFPLKYYCGQFNAYQRTYVLETRDEQVLSTRYLYYALRLALAHFKSASIGAATQYLTKGILDNFQVPLPPVDIQNRIVSIIARYDDLIENNARRIELLEQAAQMLFSEWFVRHQYPEHEHDELIDGVPNGWHNVCLGDILEIESGGRPRGGANLDDGIPSIGAENVLGIGRYDYGKDKYVSDAFFDQMRRGIIKNGDVVLYKDGANIGRASYFGEGFPHAKCAVNEHVFILRSRALVGQSFLYFWIARRENRQAIVNLNSNTAQPGISQEKLRGLRFLVPPERLTRAFNELVDAQVSQILKLALMNRKLSVARDLLLPRLMDGRLSV